MSGKTTVDVLNEAADYIEQNGLAHEDFVKFKEDGNNCFCLAGTLAHVATGGYDHTGVALYHAGAKTYEAAVLAVVKVGGIEPEESNYGSPLRKAERGIWNFNDRKKKIGDRERFAFQKRDAVRLLRKTAKAVTQ